jgi:hypothetical protein
MIMSLIIRIERMPGERFFPSKSTRIGPKIESMDGKNIVKVGSSVLIGSLFVGSFTVEQPHTDSSPPPIVATFSNPHTASGSVIEETWQATIESIPATFVRRRTGITGYWLVSMKLPDSTKSLFIFHTARDSTEALFASTFL